MNNSNNPFLSSQPQQGQGVIFSVPPSYSVKPQPPPLNSSNPFIPQNQSLQLKNSYIMEPPLSFPSNRPPVITGQFTQYGNSETMNAQNINEISTILVNFVNSMDTKCPENLFKYMVYNTIPKEHLYKIQYEELKRYFPYQINEEGGYNCIDYNMWQKASKYSPNSNLFYPFQISSVSQLKNRVKNLNDKQNIILNQYKLIKRNLEKINGNFEIKVEDEFKVIKQKRKLIKEKFIKICNLVSNIAIAKGKAKKDVELEQMIMSKVKNIKKNINETSEIKKQIDIVSSIPPEVYTDNYDDENNILNTVSKGRMFKNKKVINELTNLLSFSFDNLKKNIAIIKGIRNDLDFYKINEHFK